MNILLSIARDFYSYFVPNTRLKAVRLGVLVLIVIIAVVLLVATKTDKSTDTEVANRVVQTMRVSEFNNATTFELIGTVDAINQAIIQSEVSGRVTSVPVQLGQAVNTGTVIAQLENASQYASLLQAEGVYDSAVAGAAQGDVSVSEAENTLRVAEDNAVRVYRDAFTTFRTILLNDVDNYFSDPQGRYPGLRISGGSRTSYLTSERISFQEVLTEWQTMVATVDADYFTTTGYNYAVIQVSALTNVIDTLIALSQDDKAVGIYSKAELQALSATLSADRAVLNATLATLDTARTSLASAERALAKAQIGSTNPTVSTANAQVKQALGALKAAQANYAKTILRTPINGVINSLDVKSGDFISAFTTIAIVANNNALEITTFVNEADKNVLSIGQTVLIDNTVEGIISNIAPAINPTTKKTEVKIQTESTKLSNGDTVKVSIVSTLPTVTENTQEFSIPLTAVKFTSTDGAVFTVENDILVEHPVSLGTIQGSSVLITGGVTSDMSLVVDARGLNAGQIVETN